MTIAVGSYGKRIRSQVDYVLGAILLGTFLLFWNVLSFDYINYDDQNWISANKFVEAGITIESLKWAAIGVVNSTWCPLTNLSFVLEGAIFGIHPGISHLINLMVHLLNVALVFRFSCRMLQHDYAALFATFLFAMHPVNVEAVCWVSDRKGVLSGFFLLLSLINYIDHALNSKKAAYLSSVSFYLLSVASKPSVITVPFLLFFIDLWLLLPIRANRRIFEKIPFFLISLTDAVVVFLIQSREGGIAQHGFLVNVQTACIGCARYISNMFFPMDLNVCYFHPGIWPAALIFASVSTIILSNLIGILAWKQSKIVLISFWMFLITLAPVLEFIPAGHAYMADRYAYIAYLWLFLGLASLVRHLIKVKALLVVFLISGWCSYLAWYSLGLVDVWRNSITIFTRAIQVDPENPIAHANLAFAYNAKGLHKEATKHIELSLKNPSLQGSLLTAAEIFSDAGDEESALNYLHEARSQIYSAETVFAYANFLAHSEKYQDPKKTVAIVRHAQIMNPSPIGLDLLARCLVQISEMDRAKTALTNAINLDAAAGSKSRLVLVSHLNAINNASQK
jgi:Tfp pilus assembly protein PilF